MNAIDTNVLVYAVDASEPKKSQQARALLVELETTATRFILPWQVAGEFLACLTRWERHGKIDRCDTLQYLNQFVLRMAIVMPTTDILTMALDLGQKYSLGHWDSMLLAACSEAEVSTLYSEDLGHGQTYGSVTVVNPFEKS